MRLKLKKSRRRLRIPKRLRRMKWREITMRLVSDSERAEPSAENKWMFGLGHCFIFCLFVSLTGWGLRRVERRERNWRRLMLAKPWESSVRLLSIWPDLRSSIRVSPFFPSLSLFHSDKITLQNPPYSEFHPRSKSPLPYPSSLLLTLEWPHTDSAWTWWSHTLTL